MNLTSQIIDAIGKSPIAFSKVVNGNNVNGWISREMWVLPDAIKRVEKKWPSLNRGNIALLCGASSELPETLAAFAPGLSKFPLIAIPDVDVRSIVALFRTGAYAEENNNLPPIFDSIRLKLNEGLRSLFNQQQNIRQEANWQQENCQGVQEAVEAIYKIAPFNIIFATEAGLRAKFHRPVSKLLAKKIAQIIEGINIEASEAIEPLSVAEHIHQKQEYRLWWD